MKHAIWVLRVLLAALALSLVLDLVRDGQWGWALVFFVAAFLFVGKKTEPKKGNSNGK